MLAGLEKKQDYKDRASSRTQAMRNSVGNNDKVINNKLQTKTIHEKKENALANIENAKKEDYDYDFEDDVIERNNLGGNDVPENGEKAEYYYYYYYDYLDSGIDISHELSNSETAGYEPLPTPLGLVSEHPDNSIDGEDDTEKEGKSKSEITSVSDNTTGDEDTILNLENVYSDNTGDSDDNIIDKVNKMLL